MNNLNRSKAKPYIFNFAEAYVWRYNWFANHFLRCFSVKQLI
jgi:hypothetical protein